MSNLSKLDSLIGITLDHIGLTNTQEQDRIEYLLDTLTDLVHNRYKLVESELRLRDAVKEATNA